MGNNFKYFTPGEDSDTSGDISLALNVVAREKLLLDISYLPVLQSAEKGNFFALCEMQEAFAYGAHGVPRHYGLARTYTDRIKKKSVDSLEPKIEALRNSAKLELMEDNKEAAKQEFIKAITLTVNNLPPEKWDFNLFNYIYDLVHPSDSDE